METIKSRSASPFSRNKANSQLSGASENGSMIIEEIKAKKKNHKNKYNSKQNGNDNENIENNGKDFEEEKEVNEVDDSANSNNTECEIALNNGDNTENRNGDEKVQEVENSTENDALINVCDIEEESVSNESNSKTVESETTDEFKSSVAAVDVEDDSTKTSETESNAKKDNSVSADLLPDSNSANVECETFENNSLEKPNDTLNGGTAKAQEMEPPVEVSDVNESFQTSINGSEAISQGEQVNVIEDQIQASPDTATKEDNSFSNKISNFFGKLSYSNEQKQDSEVSSSKKIDGGINHPYFSKVSGRRGIKDRLNSSATVFSSKEMEVKTPENSGISLDDSFRVRTNPPRLNSLDMSENPTLRKFKGKRCLNAGDEPEEEEDVYYNSMKKRKLVDNTQEPGFLGSLLWSPFKKKSLEEDDQIKLTTNESKLSRFLSPFWFWKKTATVQKGK